jgi:hypothetical protein
MFRQHHGGGVTAFPAARPSLLFKSAFPPLDIFLKQADVFNHKPKCPQRPDLS